MANGDSTNPFVGPVPFSTEQRDFFFGRDEEAQKLLSLAISERIVLFYAQSGAGKSSLINARLIPNLESKGYNVLPVARVGGDLPDSISVDKIDNVFVFNALLSLAGGKKSLFGDLKKDAKAQLGKSLSDYVKEQKLVGGKPHWLIIDQFEEIITTHPAQDREKRKDFFRQLNQMLEADEMLSLVLVMREDHLAGLDSFAPLVPDRLTKRYRIEPLRRTEAEQAVRYPALKGGRTFEQGAVEHLVRDLSQERIADQEDTRMGEYVEPLFLQLVCFSLWKSLDEVKSQKLPVADKVITKNDVETYGDIDLALRKFYGDAVKQVADKTGTDEMAIRRWFGETLITPSGIRAQVDRGILKSGGLSNKAIDQLNEEHLIRLEEARGGKWYELSHDRFIKPIQDANEEWLTGGAGDSRLARAARLWNTVGRDESFLYRGRLLQNALARYEKNKESAGRLENEFLTASTNAEAKRTRQYGGMIAAMGILLIAAIGFGFFGMRKSLVAQTQARDLLKANETEVQLRKEAEIHRGQAEESREQAIRESKKLTVEQEKLNRANEDLEDQTKLAETARNKEKVLRIQAQQRERRERMLRRRVTELSAYRLEALQKRLSDEESSLQWDTEPFPSRECDNDGMCKTENPIIGEIKWRRLEKGGFEFLDGWEKNLEDDVEIPQLRNVQRGVKAPIQFFRAAVPQLKAAWEEIEKAKLLDSVKSWDGSIVYYNASEKMFSPTSHSMGLAFDVNTSFYVKSEQVVPALPKEFTEIFAKHGFRVSHLGPGLHIELIRLDKPSS